MVRVAETFFVYARAWLSLGTFYSQRVAWAARDILYGLSREQKKSACRRQGDRTTALQASKAGCLPYLRIEQDYATMGENGTAKDREKEFHEVLKKARKSIEQTLR